MLAAKQVEIRRERSTKKAPLSQADVEALLASVERVWLARGASVEERAAREVVPADLKGPTGNFRAPLVRRGKLLLVGFHAAALERLL